MMINSFLSTVFVALVVAPMAKAVNNNLFFSMGKYNITVTGNQNVPKYTFTSLDYPGTTYKIMYQSIFETDDNGGKVSGSTISLPSVNWLFELDKDDESVFWIRSNGRSGNQVAPWSKLEFKNILSDDKVKFDVILDGYQWTSPAAAALNFAWKFSEGSDEGEIEDEEPAKVEENDPSLEPDAPDPAEPTQLCFGQGIMCFDIADKASVTDFDGVVSEIDVKLTSTSEDGVTVTYEKFDGDLYHDPSFSYAEEESSDGGILGAILSFFQMFIPCL